MFTEEEFLKALSNFDAIIPDPIEYRLHYNDMGDIIMCSYQNHPDSRQYLIVDQEIYNDYVKYRVNVAQKKLEEVVFDLRISVKLKRSNRGYAVVRNHAGLILELDEKYKDVEHYEATN